MSTTIVIIGGLILISLFSVPALIIEWLRPNNKEDNQ